MIIGIDPGLKGGICLAQAAADWETYAMPVTGGEIDLVTLKKILSPPKYPPVTGLVVIEKVHSMPKQGVVSTFKFGDGYGQLKGLCVGLNLPFILITPQAWKRVVLAGYNWKGAKGTSIIYVKQKYPYINLKLTEQSRRDSHGLADAVCLAEYGVNLFSLSQAMDKEYKVKEKRKE